MDTNMSGKLVVVTGATGGIGKEIARESSVSVAMWSSLLETRAVVRPPAKRTRRREGRR